MIVKSTGKDNKIPHKKEGNGELSSIGFAPTQENKTKLGQSDRNIKVYYLKETSAEI